MIAEAWGRKMKFRQWIKNIDVIFIIVTLIIWIKNMMFFKIVEAEDVTKPGTVGLNLLLSQRNIIILLLISLAMILLFIKIDKDTINKYKIQLSLITLVMLMIPVGYFYLNTRKTYMVIYLSFVIIFTSIGLYFNGEKRVRIYMIMDFILSFLTFFELVYYRAYGNFLNIRYIYHFKAFNPDNKNLFLYMKSYDILFFIDIIIVSIIMKKCNELYRNRYKSTLRNVIIGATTSITICLGIYWVHYMVDIKDITRGDISLFKDGWTLDSTMLNLSPLGYHFYEILKVNTICKNQELTSEEIREIEQWYENNDEKLSDNKYKSILKEKNLIFIQVESLENFVIEEKVEEQEITPNLNKMLHNSYYFNNIYEQVIYNSADGDFIANTSIYPLRKQSTYIRYPFNIYNGMSSIMNKAGYKTIASRSENGARWNWRDNYYSYGYNKIYDNRQYNFDDLIGTYIADGTLYRQTIEILKQEQTPFFLHMITFSSHGPFLLPENKKILNIGSELNSNVLGQYFHMINYVDREIGNFIKILDENNLLKETVLVIYGDHAGPHRYNQVQINDAKDAKEQWKQHDIKVPLIIYNPSIVGEKKEIIGGQIDIMPTVLYLLGVEKENYINSCMGKNLLNTKRNYTILQSEEIVGQAMNKKEENHIRSVFDISSNIIRGNYFKNKLH